MVLFWPWKGDDNSAASFEKILSSLSTKISKASTKSDGLRQHQRRYRALWTLYTGFAYVLAALILTLVTGWRNWTPSEYTGLAVGPVFIFGVRTAIDAYYNYRLTGSETYLNDLYRQREEAITKLKAATKYNSTQELLEKYGGTPRKPSDPPNGKRKTAGKEKPVERSVGRTGIAPPPTANIPGRSPISSPHFPQNTGHIQPGRLSNVQSGTIQQAPDSPGSPSEEFAPNAFSTTSSAPRLIAPAAAEYAFEGPRWYDRIMDLVLGEDETQPKNRIILICQSCRLVNGQAPPGTRSLEDLGKWRCSECGTMNGVESETARMMRQVAQSDTEDQRQRKTALEDDADLAIELDTEDSDDHQELDQAQSLAEKGGDSADVLLESPPASSTRSKSVRQRKVTK